MIRRAVFLLALLVFSSSFASALECAPPAPGPRTLLKKGNVVFVGTVTRGEGKDGVYSFHVTEAFKGVTGDNLAVMPTPGAYAEFQVGEEYLVFANPFTFDTGEKIYVVRPCSLTQPLKYAQALVQQLRAEKCGKRVASVYGMLFRTTDPLIGIWTESYERPLPGIVITLQSTKKKFETTTDEHGVYAFQQLPRGTYQVSADLPPGLALGEPLKEGPLPPFNLPRHSSFDYELDAMPTGSITGEVIGPDGNALRSTSVELYLAEKYGPKKLGAYAYQGEGKPFRFYHLPPGDYILVFDRNNDPSPDDPFLRTFYPGAANLEQAERISLSNGQEFTNADIHVARPLPTRRITIHLDWAGKKPSAYYRPDIIVSATKGESPYPFKSEDGVYTLNLFLDAQYTLRAEAYCQLPTKGVAKSPDVIVDGKQTSVSDVSLILDQGGCETK